MGSNSTRDSGASPQNRKTLWWAYAIAPAVAPTLFAVMAFVGGMIELKLNPDDTGTPIGVILVPIMSLTIGVVASYAVAGAIGMPIAFLLRKRRILNGYTIHGAAFLWVIVFSTLLTASNYIWTTPPRPAPAEFLLPSLYLFLMIAPCILLSATTFWWIVSRDKRQLSLRVLFLIVTAIAVLAAAIAAIFR